MIGGNQKCSGGRPALSNMATTRKMFTAIGGDSLWLCKINLLRIRRDPATWTRKYFKIRDGCSFIELVFTNSRGLTISKFSSIKTQV